MKEPCVLDLCAGTGAWSEPYVKAGVRVLRIDLPQDVRLLERLDEDVYGILAAPPCTVFAASGARWPRSEEDFRQALSVVDACLRAVVIYRPKWWALENPVGKLGRWLGKPRMYFQPCDYGDPYTKKTALWGDFTPPAKNPVAPTQGSRMWARYGGRSDKTKRERSKTPPGFAEAFAAANPVPRWRCRYCGAPVLDPKQHVQRCREEHHELDGSSFFYGNQRIGRPRR